MAPDHLSGIDQKVTAPGTDRSADAANLHATSSTRHRRFRRIRRLRAAARNHPPLDLTWRVGVLIAGVLTVVAGAALLVLPGPGALIIFIGLGVLATEFDWAQRILHQARDRAHAARQRAKDPRSRRRMITVTILMLLVAGVAGWWYVETFGLTVPSWLLR